MSDITSHSFNYQKAAAAFGPPAEFLCWHIGWYALHPRQTFDVIFYDREPLLTVQLAPDFIREWHLPLRPIEKITFSDGTIADLSDVWMLNYMPADLDIDSVDLAEGERVIGADGETIREIIRITYRCQSRAEEDHFLRRWLAS
jgi:hypothetical protein